MGKGAVYSPVKKVDTMGGDFKVDRRIGDFQTVSLELDRVPHR